MSAPRLGPARKLAFGLVAAVLALGAVELLLWLVALGAGQDWRVSALPDPEDYAVICPMDEQILRVCPEIGQGYKRVRPEMFLREQDRPRVIVVGESFVFGLHLEMSQAWPAVLERELGGAAEVLNWGRCGSYSSRLAPVVDAAVELEPELLVLAIGNNDHTMTSFYTGWPARHPGSFYAVSEALGRFRLYGLLARAVGGVPKPQEVQDLRVELTDPVAHMAYSARRRPPDLSAFEDELAPPEVTLLLEREQRLKERIFRDRLRGFVRRAQDAGVPVLLATLPRNLRTPPVLSGIHGGDPEVVRSLVRELATDPPQGREELLRRGFEEDPRVAAFQHGLAELLLAVGRKEEAADAYRAAADWDLVPDSTPGLNAVVRDVAAETGCPLADLALLSERYLAQEHSIFADRVHVNAEGAELVAADLAPAVRELLGL